MLLCNCTQLSSCLLSLAKMSEGKRGWKKCNYMLLCNFTEKIGPPLIDDYRIPKKNQCTYTQLYYWICFGPLAVCMEAASGYYFQPHKKKGTHLNFSLGFKSLCISLTYILNLFLLVGNKIYTYIRWNFGNLCICCHFYVTRGIMYVF
jgi:hypothetical protein